MAIGTITDHAARYQDRFSGELAGATNLIAMAGVLSTRIQALETLFQALLTERAISTAVGTQLDKLGVLLQQPRLGGPWPNGETDAAYQPKLLAAGLRNTSWGTIDQLLAIVVALHGTNLIAAHLTEHYPAGFALALAVTLGLTADEEATLVSFITDAKPAAVGIESMSWYDGLVFGFIEDPDPLVGTLDDGTLLAGAGTFANVFAP